MIIYTKNEFLKHCRKVRWGKITGPVSDSFWRNNLARFKKEQAGEPGPKSTLVFYSLDDPKIDVEATLNRNRNLWIVDHKGNPVNLPDIHCPIETIQSNSMFENDNLDLNFDLPEINLDLHTETNDQDSEFNKYPVLWIGDDGVNESIGFGILQNDLANMTEEHEKDRMSAIDVFAVMVEILSEYFQAVSDFKTSKKYQSNEIITDDTEISIYSKKLAIEFCKKLIPMYETEIEDLKNELKRGDYG
ncbi:MAG: hypothetical protein HOC24_07605 [Deltaproteobacteria bacterium]|jgi:hypothetical protein|nr:hypothetical protein [Deltaproteobacteria bacterium]